MLHVLFGTWFGGVVCTFIVLVAVGTPIINWINKEKKLAQERFHRVQEELKRHKAGQ